MTEKIDLNRADIDELTTIPGIDEDIAERIIEHRNTIRPFSDISELSAVEGISEETLQAIGEKITITPTVEAPPPEESTIELEDETETADEATATTADSDEQNGQASPVPDTKTLSGDGEGPVIEDQIVLIAEELSEEVRFEEPVGPLVEERDQSGETRETTVVQQPITARPGSSLWGHMSAAAVGALCGVVLTLAALWLLNGTLLLNDTADINDLETKLIDNISTVQLAQLGLDGHVGTLDEQITILTTVDSDMASSLNDTQLNLDTVEHNVVGVAEEVEALQETAIEFDERLVAVAVSAENFDAFLEGLRDLLFTLQGPLPELVMTPTVTITTTIPTPSVEATLELESTPFSKATRTPRPTATSFALPTKKNDPTILHTR